MKQIRYLCIQFTTPIKYRELSLFRGAVIRTVDPGQVLFHNHLGDGYRYSYPLIQYKRIKGRAALVCLGDGVDAIHAMFLRPIHTLRLGNEEVPFQIDSMSLKQYNMRVYDHLRFQYRIEQWLPLNAAHYATYQQMSDPADQLKFLRSILRGNILSMAKGLGWHIDEEVRIDIQSINAPQAARYKDVRLMAFNTVFQTNVYLPPFVGLGKGVAKGWGLVDMTNTRAGNEQKIIKREINELV